MNIWLDPDFRKNPPRNEDGSFKPHCCRCQKFINVEKSNYKRVTTDEPGWNIIDQGGDQLIGLDCWKKITEESA